MASSSCGQTETGDNNTSATATTNQPLHPILRSVRTGPPIQQHKDRNSFKFHSVKGTHHRSGTTTGSGGGGGSSTTSTTTTSHGKLIVEMPTLAELYQATALLTVVYTNPVKPQYNVSYPLNQLLIHESKWLILNLSLSSALSSSSTSLVTRSTTGRLNGSALVAQQQQQQQLAKMVTNGTVQSTVDNNQYNYDDDDDDEGLPPPPTLRVQMTLEGPYRPEIGAMLRLIQVWISFVDHVNDKLIQFSSIIIPNHYYNIPIQWMLVPIVPILAIIVVGSPVIVGMLMLLLPLVFPLMVLLVIVMTGFLGIGGIWYGSSRTGRTQITTLCHPIYQSLIHTKTGQEWIYQTGPRPTMVQLLQSTGITPTSIWNKLLLSLWIDLMGSATYLIPVVGEGLDVFWAPFQTTMIMAMYCCYDSNPSKVASSSSSSPNIASSSSSSGAAAAAVAIGMTALPYMSFMEEILPFTDVIPSATLGWLGEFFVYPLLVRRQENGAHDPSLMTMTTTT